MKDKKGQTEVAHQSAGLWSPCPPFSLERLTQAVSSVNDRRRFSPAKQRRVCADAQRSHSGRFGPTGGYQEPQDLGSSRSSCSHTPPGLPKWRQSEWKLHRPSSRTKLELQLK
ncbi:uncharacterized protein WM277_022569 [Molossus nigricans]